jgi:uncharacterized protein
MTIEVRPVGVTCQLRCKYCYEEPLRTAAPIHVYDREAVLASIEKLDSAFSLFGGEPLILNLKDLEELLSIAYTRWGHSGLQTNGTLITEAHIDLFRKYNTHTGISLDGPGVLNRSRWIHDEATTDKHTDRTHWSIKRLCEEAKTTPHLLPSLIVTMHAGNAGSDVFPQLVEWFKQLDAMGIQSVNLHVMELDAKADELYLSQDELSDRLIDLWNLQDSLTQLRFTKFQEVLKLLQADDANVVCTWHSCDPLNTVAVHGIENDGSPSHCSRTNKDGINWMPAEGSGKNSEFIGHKGNVYHERQLALYVTPQEYGGCQGCEYWLLCKGQCPGEGEQQDWRMRSHYCLTYKKLFAEAAKRLRAMGIQPISDWSYMPDIERRMYEMWAEGQSPEFGKLATEYKDFISKGMTKVRGGWHGDHSDAAKTK